MLALTSPGEVLLGPGISIAFLGGGLLVGILPLLISPTFRQIVRAIPPTYSRRHPRDPNRGLSVPRAAGYASVAGGIRAARAVW